MTATEQTVQEVKKPIKRYNFYVENPTHSDPFGVKCCDPAESASGEYVQYSDYLAAKLNPNGFVLTKDDAAVYRMLQAIIDITGDCEQSETFSGWQLQAVQKSGTNEFLKIELIATDKIGDIVAPRV